MRIIIADVYRHHQLHHPITKFHMCRLGEGQRMNRFFQMQQMARKNTLAKRLQRLQALFPNDYDFIPQVFWGVRERGCVCV
jgi:hypothetical protein